MEIVNYVRILRRRWRLVVVFVVLGLAVGAASTFIGGTQPDVSLYKATITLTSNGDKSVNLSQLAALTTESDVSNRAAAKLGGSPAALASQITAKASPELDLLKITAVGQDPTRSVQIANTFGQEIAGYQVELQGRVRDAQVAELQKQKEDLRPLYDAALRGAADEPQNKEAWNQQYEAVLRESKDLDSQITRLRSQSTSPSGVLTVVSTAEAVPVSGKAVAQLFADQAPKSGASSGNSNTSTTTDPQSALESDFSAPDRRIGPVTRAGIGGFVGLLLGAAIALVIERIDPRIRTKSEAEDSFGWPVITETPPISRKQRKQLVVLSHDAPRSRFAESYRSLRSAVLFASAVADGTAATDSRELPSGGRARLGGASLAAEYHAAGDRAARVLMVTSPSPSEGKTTTTSNLAAVLGEADFRVLVINCDFRRPRVHAYLGAEGDSTDVIATSIPNVSLVNRVLEDPDAANPAEVVAAQRAAIERNAREFDFIVLDTAPLLSTNDAAEILDESDFVVVVGRTGQTTKEAADRAAELLERRNAPVVGVVLVGATDRPSSRYYYYGDSGRYYEDHHPNEGNGNGAGHSEPDSDAGAPLSRLHRSDARTATSGESSSVAAQATGPVNPGPVRGDESSATD